MVADSKKEAIAPPAFFAGPGRCARASSRTGCVQVLRYVADNHYMGSFVVRSKLLAIVGVMLLLVGACTSSGDAAESGATTTAASQTGAASQSDAASSIVAAGSADPSATDDTANDGDSASNTDNTAAASSDETGDDEAADVVGTSDDGTRTDIEPDGFDDGAVLVDTDGVFDNTAVSAVILECAAGEQAACGNLGARLAQSDSMSESDRAAAICTAGPLLAVDGQSRLAGIITLSLLLADAAAPISGPIETVRLALPGDPQLDSAIAAAAANASLSC